MTHSTFTTEFTKVLKANNDSIKGFDHLSVANIKLICDIAKKFGLDAKATIEALQTYYGYPLSGDVVATIESNFDNGLEEIKESGSFGDLKENTIALNNLKDRIYTDYVSQRISGLNTQVIHIMQNSKDIKSFSHSLSRVLSLANTITTQYDYNEIEAQETWVLNKLGSLIEMIAYDIRDLQRQADALI